MVLDGNFIFIFLKMMQTSSIYMLVQIIITVHVFTKIRQWEYLTSYSVYNVAKYAHLMFKKRKQILSHKSNWLVN